MPPRASASNWCPRHKPRKEPLQLSHPAPDRPFLIHQPRVLVHIPNIHRAAHHPQSVVVLKRRDRLTFVEFHRGPLDAVGPEKSRAGCRDVRNGCAGGRVGARLAWCFSGSGKDWFRRLAIPHRLSDPCRRPGRGPPCCCALLHNRRNRSQSPSPPPSLLPSPPWWCVSHHVRPAFGTTLSEPAQGAGSVDRDRRVLVGQEHPVGPQAGIHAHPGGCYPVKPLPVKTTATAPIREVIVRRSAPMVGEGGLEPPRVLKPTGS